MVPLTSVRYGNQQNNSRYAAAEPEGIRLTLERLAGLRLVATSHLIRILFQINFEFPHTRRSVRHHTFLWTDAAGIYPKVGLQNLDLARPLYAW